MSMAVLEPLPPPPPKVRCTAHAFYRRCRVGPTGGQRWMILADTCYRCGLIRPLQKLTHRQRFWVHRWNRFIRPAAYYEKA